MLTHLVLINTSKGVRASADYMQADFDTDDLNDIMDTILRNVSLRSRRPIARTTRLQVAGGYRGCTRVGRFSGRNVSAADARQDCADGRQVAY